MQDTSHPLPNCKLQRTRTLKLVIGSITQVSLGVHFSRGWCLEMLTLFQLIFPRKFLPEGGTYCRETQLQQSKGPGTNSGQDQNCGVQLCNGVRSLSCLPSVWGGGPACLPAPLLPRAALGLSSSEPLDAAGCNLPGTAELFLTGRPIARTEPFSICCSGGFPFGAQSARRRKIG